jgi:hypothetical protein
MTPYGRRNAWRRFIDYVVLDGLIGNTDRHHENWALLLREHTGEEWNGLVAPTFDHASSLGRELVDESAGKCRRRLLSERRVGQYSEKARGAIFWAPGDAHGLPPLELVRRGARVHPEFFGRSLRRLEYVDRAVLENIVGRIPTDWMSDLARTFAVELMAYNLGELRKVVV